MGALNLSLYPNPINAFVANFIATFIDLPPVRLGNLEPVTLFPRWRAELHEAEEE